MMTIFKRKRADRVALRAEVDKGVARLAASVKSIINDPSANKNEMLGRSFAQYLQHVGNLTKTRIPLQDVVALLEIFKNDSERSEPDLSDTDAGYGGRRRRQYEDEAADRTQALSEGEEDNRRDDDDDDHDESDDNEKDTTMKTLLGLAKRYGWQSVCKNFVESGTGNFSETEVTEFLTAVAQKSYPDLPADQAFSKAYSAMTPDGELMRRTTLAARDTQFASRQATMGKAATLAPRVTGGRAALAVDDPSEVMRQLDELTTEQLRRNPAQTREQAFAQVYSSNPDLAAKERLANRPVASW